jgi:hypothetical protein
MISYTAIRTYFSTGDSLRLGKLKSSEVIIGAKKIIIVKTEINSSTFESSPNLLIIESGW